MADEGREILPGLRLFMAGHALARQQQEVQLPSLEVLRMAINRGDVNRVRRNFASSRHRLPNNADSHGLLKYALSRDQVEFFYLLSDKGAPVVGYDKPGESTFLHYAAEKNDVKLAKNLFGHQVAELAVNENGETPVHVAAKRDNREVLYVLLEHLPVTNRVATLIDNEGVSLFHILCMTPEPDYVRQFLRFRSTEFRVTSAISADSKFCPGYAGLHFACAYYRHETVELLLEHGAEAGAATAAGLTALHLAGVVDNLEGMLKEALIDATSAMDERERLQHCVARVGAALEQRRKIARMLLSAGCEVGESALLLIAQFRYPARKPPPSARNDPVQEDHMLVNALPGAADDPQPRPRIDELLERWRLRGPALRRSETAKYAKEALQSDELGDMLQQEQLSMIKLLLKHWNEDVDLDRLRCEEPLKGLSLSDDRGYTCLHHLAATPDVPKSTLLLLLNCGADVNAADLDGRSPLHVAAENGNKSFIEILTRYNERTRWEKKLNVNARDNAGNTPLRLVKLPIDRDDSFPNQNECFCMLLNAGADIYEEEEKDDAYEFSSEVRGHVMRMIMNKDFARVLQLYRHCTHSGESDVEDEYLHEAVESRVYIQMVDALVKYLKMTEACKRYNLKLHYNFLDRVCKKLYSASDESAKFESVCNVEVEQMKQIKIGESASLYDLMAKKAEQVAALMNDDVARDTFDFAGFDQQFQVYGTLLKARYINALAKMTKVAVEKKS